MVLTSRRTAPEGSISRSSTSGDSDEYDVNVLRTQIKEEDAKALMKAVHAALDATQNFEDAFGTSEDDFVHVACRCEEAEWNDVLNRLYQRQQLNLKNMLLSSMDCARLQELLAFLEGQKVTVRGLVVHLHGQWVAYKHLKNCACVQFLRFDSNNKTYDDPIGVDDLMTTLQAASKAAMVACCGDGDGSWVLKWMRRSFAT